MRWEGKEPTCNARTTVVALKSMSKNTHSSWFSERNGCTFSSGVICVCECECECECEYECICFVYVRMCNVELILFILKIIMKEFALGFAHTKAVCFFLCLFFSLLQIFLRTQKTHLLLALNMLAHTFIPRQAFDEKKHT